MTSVPPGPLAGRYELGDRIAATAAAEVFAARDRDLDRTVAIKVLTPALASDPQVVERFRAASSAAATVRDPHVVTVYDWGEDQGTAFLAMEYVAGRDLGATLRETQRVAPDRVASIGASAADGLEAAHRVGVVHGGLTPSDVLLATSGDVKLCDFGTAAAGLTGYAADDGGVAAAQHASPEQLQGRPADARSDLYALGSVLYAALTGAPPFTETDAVSLTERKLRARPAAPSSLAPSVPPALDSIVERLLEIDPNRRYGSAAEAAADLRRLGATLAAPPVTATAPVVVATVPEAPTSILPTTPAAVPEPEEKSRTGWIVASLIVLALVVAGVIAWLVLKDDDSQKARVAVPAVVGQPVGAASAAITAAGLSPSTVNEPSDQFAENLVFEQSPAANTKAPKDSVVVLKVSTGPTTTTTSSTSTTSTSTSTTTTTTSTTTSTTTTTVPPPPPST